MKRVILMGIVALLSSFQTMAQKSEEKAIKNVITAFAKAGDQNDASALASLLDDNYRLVMNQLFGSKEVSIMPRAVYLKKIKNKEFGGDQRTLTFKEIILNGNTAMAKATFAGKKMTFESLLVLVKNSNGEWKLISDIPVIN